jgi:UPF0716 protein FxsA
MWLIVAILAIPLIEIALFVVIGGAIGLWATLIWVILAAALGIIVLKGVASLGPITLSRDLREIQDVASPLAHRTLVVIAGALLVLPGFMTDAVGLFLLVPPLRRIAIRWAGRRLQRTQRAAAPPATVIDGEWHEVDPRQTATSGTPPTDTRH